jgi:hypothetical protein
MANVVVERVAKSRVSNRSDSKKSDSGTQKVGYFVGYHALFTPNFMGFFIKSCSGRGGYIPDMEKSGSGSPKKSGSGRVPENLGPRSTTRPMVAFKKSRWEMGIGYFLH